MVKLTSLEEKSLEVNYKESLLLKELEYKDMIYSLHVAETDKTGQADICSAAGISLSFTRKASLEDYLSGELFLLTRKNYVLFDYSLLSASCLAKKKRTPTYIFLDPQLRPHIWHCH